MAYLAMLYLGVISGIIVSNYVAKMAGLDSARFFIATVLLTIPNTLGVDYNIHVLSSILKTL